MTSDQDTYTLWKRTAFIEFNGGHEYFTKWFPDLFCTIMDIFKTTYKMVSPNQVMLAIIPFMRDFSTLSGDEACNKMALNLFNTGCLLSEITGRCKEIKYRWTLLEPPILPNQQIVSFRCAVLCREINNLNLPNHVPARIWNETWATAGKANQDFPCLLPNRQDWSIRKDLFTNDRRHLSILGYNLWLRVIFSSTLLYDKRSLLTDPFEDDFCDIRPSLVVTKSTPRYFQFLLLAKMNYEKQPSNHNSYNIYKRYKSRSIDCSDLVRKIHKVEIRPQLRAHRSFNRSGPY